MMYNHLRMNITIKATHSELTDASRAMIEQKLSALHKFVGDEISAQCACEIQESLEVVRSGSRFRAEGNLSVSGKSFRAEAVGETLEEAVDTLRDELMREVQRVRGKSRSFLRRGGAALKRMLRMQ
jgi:putative sigma-54 modulation protein